MIARQLGEEAGAASPLARLRRLFAPGIGDGTADYPETEDGTTSLAESISALGFFSALIAVLSAGSVIGRGYAQSDVVGLIAIQLVASVAIWRAPWRGVSDVWLLAVVGVQAVFVASVISMTGGVASPYLALYAPVLALAGWHLRAWQAAIAVGFVAVTEVWRANALEGQTSLEHLSVALPAFALITLLARLSSGRLERAVVLHRRDQVRTASTLAAVRALAEKQTEPAAPGARSRLAAEAFEASAWIHRPGSIDGARHVCSDPDSGVRHVAVPLQANGSGVGVLRLCRDEPFSSSERRLAAILAEAMARALERSPGIVVG